MLFWGEYPTSRESTEHPRAKTFKTFPSYVLPVQSPKFLEFNCNVQRYVELTMLMKSAWLCSVKCLKRKKNQALVSCLKKLRCNDFGSHVRFLNFHFLRPQCHRRLDDYIKRRAISCLVSNTYSFLDLSEINFNYQPLGQLFPLGFQKPAFDCFYLLHSHNRVQPGYWINPVYWGLHNRLNCKPNRANS